jgi:hypothetical protein
MYNNLEIVSIGCFIGILFVFGSGLNIIVLIVYSKFFSKYTSVSLLIYLAITNLLSSLIVVTLIGVEELTSYRKDITYCSLYFFFTYSTSSLSIVCLILIAYECYQIISSTKKIINITMRTKIMALVLTVGAILFSIVACFFVKINEEHKCQGNSFVLNVIMAAMLVIFFLFIAVYYVKIYFIVRKNRAKVTFVSNQMKKFSQASVNVVSPHATTTPNVAGVSSTVKKNFKTIRNIWSISRKLIFISLLYIVTWAPWTLVRILNFNEKGSQVLSFFLESLCYLNNIFNPVIYSFMSKTFRADLLELKGTIQRYMLNKMDK